MTALVSRVGGAPVMTALVLPLAFVGLSVAAGVGISMVPEGPAGSSVSLGRFLTVGLIVAVLASYALIRFGHRTVASWCLYACALGLALPGVRVTEWMTAGDLFLLLGAALLTPDISSLRLRTSVQRVLVWAVALIVMGGLLGAIAAQETQLSLLNLVRFAVASGATLLTFAVWMPSRTELNRFLMLVVVSGLATGIWALTHTEANLGRPSGFSDHPNHLALVSLVAIGPAIAFSLLRGSRAAFRIAASGATATLVGAIVVSGSRSGLIGLAGTAVVAAALMRSHGARARLVIGTATISAAAVVGFGALTTENAISRTFSSQALSTAASNQGHKAALSEMAGQIEHKPITGVGFSDPLAGHDAYLQLWAAGGILAFLGGVLVVGSLGGAVAHLRRLAPPVSVREGSWPLLASTISLSGVIVALAFQNALWNRYIWVTVALVAVSSALTPSKDAGQEP